MADDTKPGQDDATHEAPKTKGEKDATLEKALEDTFPASDPPSSGSPAKSVGWEEPKAD